MKNKSYISDCTIWLTSVNNLSTKVKDFSNTCWFPFWIKYFVWKILLWNTEGVYVMSNKRSFMPTYLTGNLGFVDASFVFTVNWKISYVFLIGFNPRTGILIKTSIYILLHVLHFLFLALHYCFLTVA